MENATVSVMNITALILQGGLCILFPFVLLIVWLVKTKAKKLPSLIGALTFAVFAMGLETLPKYFLLIQKNSVSDYILGHTWAFAAVGCLLAGIFEECGRFIAFKTVMKKYRDRRDAVTYGIGHGGFEAAFLIGFSVLSYVVMAFLMKNGMFDTVMQQAGDAVTQEQIDLLKSQITGANFLGALVGVWERLTAVTFHISLSVLVFRAAREKGKGWLFPLAILLHGVFDLVAALYQAGAITSIWLVEVLLTIAVIPVAIAAWKQYHKMPQEY